MSLFDDLWATSLEPGYRSETARRAAGGGTTPDTAGPRPPAGRRGVPAPVTVLACVAAGLLLATGAVQVQRTAPQAAQAREALLEQVDRRTAGTDALQAEVTAQQVAVAAERDAALTRDRESQALLDRVRDLEVLVGATAVTGPGLRVVLDDAPAESADALAPDAVPSGVHSPGRLLDRDLQDVVNALWASGAEAVAVDGQRLSALSAISNAGDAVLVDFRPVLPPYTVEAIGDPARLEPAFVDSPTGRRFATYVSLLGITYDVDGVDALTLPAAALRAAAGAPPPAPTAAVPS